MHCARSFDSLRSLKMTQNKAPKTTILDFCALRKNRYEFSAKSKTFTVISVSLRKRVMIACGMLPSAGRLKKQVPLRLSCRRGALHTDIFSDGRDEFFCPSRIYKFYAASHGRLLAYRGSFSPVLANLATSSLYRRDAEKISDGGELKLLRPIAPRCLFL